MKKTRERELELVKGKEEFEQPCLERFGSPRLERFGTLRELTRAKGGMLGDSGTGGSTRA